MNTLKTNAPSKTESALILSGGAAVGVVVDGLLRKDADTIVLGAVALTCLFLCIFREEGIFTDLLRK